MNSRMLICVTAVCFSLASGVFAAPPTPKITSITFSAPSPVKAGDIITVDMVGTPGCNAAFGVKDFISVVKMKEMSAGTYRGIATVPKDKVARNAPLVGYLGKDGAHAPPVQASRLITVAAGPQDTKPAIGTSPAVLGIAKSPQITQPDKLPAVRPDPPVKPAPSTQPKPATALAGDKITITTPVDGSIIKRVITVQGLAEANSAVRVEVTYSNRLSGMLKLAGQVLSQNVSADKQGNFKIGPIALDGPLATNGLTFTIKVYYPDRANHATSLIRVVGNGQ